MITDEVLDTVIDDVSESDLDLAEFYRKSARDFPRITGYLTDQDTELLTHEEHDYLLFLGAVLLKVLIASDALAEDLTVEAIEQGEDDVWGKINAAGSDPLKKLWDEVGEDEVLTDFLLDSLNPDEDSEFLTSAGAQVIFVKLQVIHENCTD